MASPTQWTWLWTNSGSWWWTGKPGLMQSMGWQRVRHDLATEQEDIRTSSWRVNQIQEKMKPKLCCLDSKFPGRFAVPFVFGVEMLAALARSPPGRSRLKEKILCHSRWQLLYWRQLWAQGDRDDYRPWKREKQCNLKTAEWRSLLGLRVWTAYHSCNPWLVWQGVDAQ